MPDISTEARRFIASQTAAVEAAFIEAFREAVDDAYGELDDEVDDEDYLDWQDLLAMAGNERRRIVMFYLPAISKMAREISFLAADYEGKLLQARTNGASAEEIEQIKDVYRALIAQKRKEIDRRMKLMYEGITWAAAELAYAAIGRSHSKDIWWNLDPSSEHCSTCPGIAAGSPYSSVDEIGGVPGSDVTQCKAKCRCFLTFRSPS